MACSAIHSIHCFASLFCISFEYVDRASSSSRGSPENPGRFHFGFPRQEACLYSIPTALRFSLNLVLLSPGFRDIGVFLISTRRDTWSFFQFFYKLKDIEPFIAHSNNTTSIKQRSIRHCHLSCQ